MSEAVLFSVEHHIAHVQLNRPEKKNAIDEPMFTGILEAARRCQEDRSIRCVVISGNGGCFSSGLDLASFGAMADGSLSADNEAVQQSVSDVSPAGASRHQQLGWAWQELPCPVIAAIEGVAYGGGFHIALGADIRIMAPDARVAFVETTWGLVPDMSGTQALRRIVPLDVAKLLVLTGEPINGAQALAYHLATQLNDDPVAAAFSIARTISERSPDAMRAAKQLLNESAFVDLADGLANEFKASGALMGTKNQIEAVMAKLEKRPARFDDPS